MGVSITDPKLAAITDTLQYSSVGQGLLDAVNATGANVSIQYEQIDARGGTFNPTTNTITVDPRDSFNAQVLSVAHELSHAYDYNTSQEAYNNSLAQQLTTPNAAPQEAANQAELSAYQTEAGVANDLQITSDFRGPDWFQSGQISTYSQFETFSNSVTDSYDVGGGAGSNDQAQLALYW